MTSNQSEDKTMAKISRKNGPGVKVDKYPSGAYFIEWYVWDTSKGKKVNDKPTGKSVARRKRYPTKKAAETAARAKLAELAAEPRPEPEARVVAGTWDGAVFQFLLHHETAGTADQTLEKYRRDLKQFGEMMQPAAPSQITTEMLERFVADRLEMPGRLPGSKVRRSTVAGNLRSVRALLYFAVDRGMVAKVPKMPKQKVPKSKGRRISDEHFGAMLDHCDVATKPNTWVQPGEWWRAYLALLASTGMRKGAALELRWGDFHRTEDGRGYVISRAEHNKGKREHRHPVPASVVGMLERLREQAPDGQERIFETGVRKESVKSLYNQFHRIQKAAGIDLPCGCPGTDHECGDGCRRYGLHDFKRFFAAKNLHLPAPVLQHLLQHKDLSTTQIYITDIEREVMEADVRAPDRLESDHEDKHPETDEHPENTRNPENVLAASLMERFAETALRAMDTSFYLTSSMLGQPEAGFQHPDFLRGSRRRNVLPVNTFFGSHEREAVKSLLTQGLRFSPDAAQTEADTLETPRIFKVA